MQALVEGATVLRGQAREGGGLPYQLWRDIVRRLLLMTETTALQQGILKPLVPDIERLLDATVPDAPTLEGEAGQERLRLTIMELVRSANGPLLLLLEDLHWAAESLEVLKHLAPLAAELPLLLVGTYRNDETPTLAQSLPDMRPMTLQRLNDEEIMQLANAMLGEAGQQPQVLDVLKRETEGNAFFMVEVVRALADEAGRLADIGRMTLPERIFAGGVQQVIRRRLNRVPEWGQALLQVVAVAGRQLDVAVLRHLVGQADDLPGMLETFMQALRKQLTPDVLASEWQRGQALELTQVRDEILATERPPYGPQQA